LLDPFAGQKPPQTNKDLFCAAVNTQSLISKALTLLLDSYLLRQQCITFYQKGGFQTFAVRARQPLFLPKADLLLILLKIEDYGFISR